MKGRWLMTFLIVYHCLMFIDGFDLPEYHGKCLQFSKTNPNSHPNYVENVKFDPKIHLALETPKTLTTTEFKTITNSAALGEGSEYDLAYTAPTRVFTEEGVRVLRSLVDKHMDKSVTNLRTHRNMRGMSYWSQFIRDFVYDTTWLDYVSTLAKKPLCPHSFGMHAVQVNIGEIGKNSDVDKWHLDSVDYVMVVLLSDIENMTGGELQVYKNVLNGRRDTKKAEEQGVNPKYVQNISYDTSGFGIFCQGSKIMHRVTPVTKAKEPRISFVISFTATDPFQEETTRTVRFTKDPEKIVAWEYARHAAWRVRDQMKYIIEESNPDDFSAADLAKILNRAADKLQFSAKVVKNEVDDSISWIEDEAKEYQNSGGSKTTTTTIEL